MSENNTYQLGLYMNTPQVLFSVKVDTENNQYSPSPNRSLKYNYKRKTLVQSSKDYRDWSGVFICDTQEDLDNLIAAYNARIIWFKDNTGLGSNTLHKVLWTGEFVVTYDSPDGSAAHVSYSFSRMDVE